jgi:RimJ/RimL family protein N-acetyltransferase
MIDRAALPFVFEHPLVTERLVLRLMTLGDVDDVFAYSSLEEVCRYQLHEPRTRDEVAEQIANHTAATTLAKDGDYLQLALELPATTDVPGRVIGDSYFSLGSVENSRGVIGWTMHPDFMGHGYATEAASAVLDTAFRTLRLHRVMAELDPRNTASIALCKRLRMREEAYFVQDLAFKGEWGDTGVYAILRDEWLSAHPE